MNTRTIFILTAIILGGFTLHLIPFFLFQKHPLGYDTGFYRRYLIEPPHAFFHPFTPGIGTDALLPGVILDTTRALGIPTDIALYGTLILANAAAAAALFVWIRTFADAHTALIATALFSFSPIQYTAYWFFLFKQIVALPMLFLTLAAIERRRILALPLALALSFSHQTTHIILLITLLLLVIFRRSEWRRILLIFLPSLAIYFLLHPLAVARIGRPPIAIFLEGWEYIKLAWPILPLAGIGLIDFIRKAPPATTFISLLVVATVFPILHLPFFQRIFLFTDVTVIILTAKGITMLVDYARRSSLPLFSFLISTIAISSSLFLANLSHEIRNLTPLLSKEEFQELSRVDEIVPQHATVLTSSERAPWVLGWTTREVVAPGLFGDRHNFEEWIAFWNATSTSSHLLFLKDFTPPLFFFLAPHERNGFLPAAPCVTIHSQFVYSFSTEREECQ